MDAATKGEWYSFANQLKALSNTMERMKKDPALPTPIRVAALEADVALLGLAVIIQTELLKDQPLLSSTVPKLPIPTARITA